MLWSVTCRNLLNCVLLFLLVCFGSKTAKNRVIYMCITCVIHMYNFVLLASHEADHEHITYNHKSHNICHDAHNYRVPVIFLPCRFIDFWWRTKNEKSAIPLHFLTAIFSYNFNYSYNYSYNYIANYITI